LTWELLLRVVGVGLLCSVAALLLRQSRGELVPLIRLGGTVLILGAILPVLGEVLERLSFLSESEHVAPYAEVMLRALGIALLAKLAGDLCRDVGEGGLASGVELAGKVILLLLSVPMMEELLDLASRILDGA
jgi:stage III sporulation protein AD